MLPGADRFRSELPGAELGDQIGVDDVKRCSDEAAKQQSDENAKCTGLGRKTGNWLRLGKSCR